MLQDSPEHLRVLERALSELAFREQSRLLFQATRHLSPQEQAMILGAGGMHLVQKRLLPLALHLLYTHFVKGAIWFVITVLLAIFCLGVLLYLGQANPGEITPTFFTTAAYFAGFFLATFVRIGKELHQLIRKTVSQQEYQRLFSLVQELELSQKRAVLRTLSMTLARYGTESWFLAPFLTEIALLLGTVFMAGFIILLSLFYMPDGLIASILLFGVVTFGFCVGFSVRRSVYAGITVLSSRRYRKKAG